MTLLILEGPEFFDSREIKSIFESFEVQVSTSTLYDAQLEKKWLASKAVIARSALAASSEDLLLARVCAKNILNKFSASSLEKSSSLFFGFGRGFLIGLQLFEKNFLKSLEWKTHESKSVWIKTMLESNPNFKFNSYSPGTAFPIHTNWPPDWKPWLRADTKVLGWEKKQQTFLSPVDIFSLSERNQLQGFGYQDLSGERVVTDVVEYFVKTFLRRP